MSKRNALIEYTKEYATSIEIKQITFRTSQLHEYLKNNGIKKEIDDILKKNNKKLRIRMCNTDIKYENFSMVCNAQLIGCHNIHNIKDTPLDLLALKQCNIRNINMFSNTTELVLDGCDNLKYIEVMNSLRHLSIKHCDKIVTINNVKNLCSFEIRGTNRYEIKKFDNANNIIIGENDELTNIEDLFNTKRKIDLLEIHNCNKISKIDSKLCIEKSLIRNCTNLKSINITGKIKTLELYELYNLNNINNIGYTKFLDLECCKNIKYVGHLKKLLSIRISCKVHGLCNLKKIREVIINLPTVFLKMKGELKKLKKINNNVIIKICKEVVDDIEEHYVKIRELKHY
jgi:hypothetical protein